MCGLATLAAVTIVAPVKLHKYAELLKALREGEPVRVVVDYKAMAMVGGEKPESGPDASSGFAIGSWERYGKGSAGNALEYLAFSDTTMISHPSFGQIYTSTRLKITSDGKATADVRYVGPIKFDVLLKQTFNGAIDSGITLYVSRTH